MSNTSDGEAIRAQGLWGLAFAKRQLEAYLGGFEGDRWVAQPCPGANHALWQVGHLAMAYHSFASKFGPLLGEIEPLDESWGELFGMGSEPIPGVSVYPDPSRVLEVMWRERQSLVDRIESVPADAIHREWETEGFIKTPAQMMSFAAIHDATHAGQLAMIRKHLGMARVFG